MHNFSLVEKEVDKKVQEVFPKKWKSEVKGWHSHTKTYPLAVIPSLACGSFAKVTLLSLNFYIEI